MIPDNQLVRVIQTKSLSGPGSINQFTTNVEYKIDHTSKTKNRKKKKKTKKSISEHCGYFETKKNSEDSRILSDHISKN